MKTERKCGIKNNNKGFSLVELIVVMAIMVIAGTTLYVGLQMVSGKPAQKMAKNVESALKKDRMLSMAKKTAVLTISYDASTGWKCQETVDGVVTTDVIIGEADVEVYDFDASTGAETKVTNLSFVFNRSDGSLRQYNGTDVARNVALKFKRAGKVYVLNIVRVTGKMNVTME